MNLENFIRVYDNVVSPQACSSIIDMFEQKQEFIQHHDTSGYKFNQLDVNTTPGMLGVAQAYAGSLLPVYENYFGELGFRDFVHIDTWEDVRIKKYEKNSHDEFRLHVDVVDHPTSARFAVAILYLNDNDGITTFPKLNLAVEPKAGRVVVFPPLWMFPHEGRTPTNNDKYIMMTCLHYK